MIVIVMGVSGSGKSTIGELLAKSLNWEFSDADSFHSPANIEKMRLGIALNDSDRTPWLETMQTVINQWLREDKNVVLACSALKTFYRQALLIDSQKMRLVYLKGSFEAIAQRLAKRQNHFMNQTLLESQFNTLQEPENAIIVDISNSAEAIVQQIISQLNMPDRILD